MITETEIYWILKLDDIQNLLMPFWIIMSFSSVIFGGVWIGRSFCGEPDCRETAKKGKKAFFICLSFALVFGIGHCFLPSTKQMAMIKVIPAIANSEIVGEMSADAKEIYKMGIQAIKEQITKNGGK
jgi:hypothetical protein